MAAGRDVRRRWRGPDRQVVARRAVLPHAQRGLAASLRDLRPLSPRDYRVERVPREIGPQWSHLALEHFEKAQPALPRWQPHSRSQLFAEHGIGALEPAQGVELVENRGRIRGEYA